LESLFSNLLDELKRQGSLDNNQALYTNLNNKNFPRSNYKGKKPWKVTKGKYCKYCKQTSHNTTNCAFLFPDKAPKGWKNKDKDDKDKDKDYLKEKSAKDTRDDNVDILYSKMTDESLESFNNSMDMDFDIDIDINDAQVNITSHILIDNITN
jgi:hypothetical protein